MSSNRLTIEELKHLLVQKHGMPLRDDDPILMVATMIEAYLNELESFLGRHEEVLQKILSTETQRYVHEVKERTEDLLERAVRANMQNTIHEIVAHQTAMNDFLNVLRKLTICSGACFVFTFALALAAIFNWIH